jgi:hypothetical protein
VNRHDLIGAWKLVSYERRIMDGSIKYPLGQDAQGLLLYTGDGYMSAQLMRRGRPDYDEPAADGGTDPQTNAAARGYLAYAGSWRLDDSSDTVTHAVTVSLLPNWLNADQIRHAALDGEYLVLSAETQHTDGTADLATLRWARPALAEARDWRQTD